MYQFIDILGLCLIFGIIYFSSLVVKLLFLCTFLKKCDGYWLLALKLSFLKFFGGIYEYLIFNVFLDIKKYYYDFIIEVHVVVELN